MHSYPALLDLTTQTVYQLGVSESFLVGRNETADICVLDPACSRHHFRIIRRNGKHFIEALSQQNPTLRNGRSVTKPEAVEHGDFLQAGKTRFQFLVKASGDSTAQKAANPPPLPAEPATVMGNLQQVDSEMLANAAFPLSNVTMIGREQDRVQIHLPHPQVSRTHACLTLEGKRATITDLNSANGTFVNGQRIRGLVNLRPGDQLDIGPYALQFTGTALIPRARSNNIELVAEGVSRIVKNRETGEPLPLLDDISLVIRPREFVCLLGPSGSGKSTLLSALSGRTTPDEGVVLVNGKDLHSNFEAIKQDIAVVPQKDVLHDSLAVDDALWYTAKLRLPPDTTSGEIEDSMSELLATVGLTARRGTLIRHLSGGQVKRASLANEILCKPSLLFLDEVTSGLDEQTDREMMNLFRSLADAGKTVVCITHSLANVERTCHLVVILTPGGKLAFVGKPSEALEYFVIDRLGDVYERLAEKSADHWQAKFRKSSFWQRYVLDRLPAETDGEKPVFHPVRGSRDRLKLVARQTRLLTTRYAAIWRSDYLSLLTMGAQSLVVAVLLGVLFGNIGQIEDSVVRAQRSVNLLFLLAVSSFWFGCNNAAKEIVKERTIYQRERDFNLRLEGYYASKLLLLTVFSSFQAILLFVIVGFWCQPPGAWVIELLVLLALAFVGVTLGLAISALSVTEEMAITLIPMVVIPQIILSGAISPLEGLSKGLALIGVSTYWGKRGLDACLPEDMAKAFPPAGLEQHSTSVAILILALHALIGVVVTLALLHFQSRRRISNR